jgi:hypothetical protein
MPDMIENSAGVTAIRPFTIPEVPEAELKALGPERLPHPHLLPRGQQRRPLRRLGRARPVRDRDPGGVRVTALTPARHQPPASRGRCTPSTRRRVASRHARSLEQVMDVFPNAEPRHERADLFHPAWMLGCPPGC